MHNTSTVFPTNIDNKVYFSDVPLQHASIMDSFKSLVSAKNYVGASQYLYDNVEQANVNMDYNGAYIWNTFENRISAIENYITTIDSTDARPYVSNTEPTDKWVGMTWISD